jgi:IS605 OrfB family transposase
LIQCAIKEGKSVFTKNKDQKVIFGSKKHFYRRIKGLITNEEIKQHRILPISIQGEETKMGNRSFKLDIINNNQIIFKVSKSNHIILYLPNLRNNYKKILYSLEQKNNIKNREKGLTYSIKLDLDNIYITFEEVKDKNILSSNRYIGIDLNPNEIGISIKEDDKILELQHFIFKTEKHSKTEFEIYEISKKIEKLFKKWNCKFVFVEDLMIKSKNHEKGKALNKLINQWIRNKFINNLEKRVTNLGGRLFKINPAYTSFIGNMIYEYSDPINASLEVGRRGYEIIILKNKRFYPELNQVKDQWKEYLTNDINSWKEFFSIVKNLKLRYRVSLNENFSVLSYLSRKSRILYYSYPI